MASGPESRRGTRRIESEAWSPRPAGRKILSVFVAISVTLTCGDDVTDPGGFDTAVWVAVSAGEDHACGLDDRGDVYCWGSNDRQQLSAPVRGVSLAPVLSDLEGTAQLSAGAGFTCVVSQAGDTRCWGDGGLGQLGNGFAFRSTIPVDVAGGPWTSVSAGGYHACGTTAEGVKCWGGDRYGASLGRQLPAQSRCTAPNGSEMWWCALEADLVDGGASLVSVSSGLWQTCGLDDSGQVACWGQNSLGQLGADATGECVIPDPVHGDARFECSWSPVPVALPEPATRVASGASHGCAVGVSGSAYCWGGTALYDGQLGHGEGEGSAVPVQVALSVPIVAVATSRLTIFTHTCGLADDGRVFCWGSNRDGELGTVTTDECSVGGGISCSLLPVEVATSERFQSIAVGERFVCGLTLDNAIWCWGLNDEGQLGDGTTASRSTPQPILDVLTLD